METKPSSQEKEVDWMRLNLIGFAKQYYRGARETESKEQVTLRFLKELMGEELDSYSPSVVENFLQALARNVMEPVPTSELLLGKNYLPYQENKDRYRTYIREKLSGLN